MAVDPVKRYFLSERFSHCKFRYHESDYKEQQDWKDYFVFIILKMYNKDIEYSSLFWDPERCGWGRKVRMSMRIWNENEVGRVRFVFKPSSSRSCTSFVYPFIFNKWTFSLSLVFILKEYQREKFRLVFFNQKSISNWICGYTR